MTVATDLLLWLWTWILAGRLHTKWQLTRQWVIGFWGLAFAACGLSALFGAISHGAAEWLVPSISMVVWWLTCALIGLASFLFAASMVAVSTLGRLRQVLLVILTLKFIAFLVGLGSNPDFAVVIFDYLPTLLLILGLSVAEMRKGFSNWGAWLGSGVMVALIGAGIQFFGISPHPNFNHNDLYHLVQAFSFYLLYRGGLLLQIREIPAKN